MAIPKDYDFQANPPIIKVDQFTTNASMWEKLKGVIARPVYRFTANYYYRLPSGEVGMVPEGFYTDFASIFRIFFILPGMTPTGPLLKGSIPHDFGYRHNWLMKHDGSIFQCNRGQAWFDDVLRKITIRDRGTKVIANTAYYALRSLGWISWCKNRRLNPNGELMLKGAYA